jgi:hypothetical protein
LAPYDGTGRETIAFQHEKTENKRKKRLASVTGEHVPVSLNGKSDGLKRFPALYLYDNR